MAKTVPLFANEDGQEYVTVELDADGDLRICDDSGYQFIYIGKADVKAFAAEVCKLAELRALVKP